MSFNINTSPQSFVDELTSKIVNLNKKQFLQQFIDDVRLSYEWQTETLKVCQGGEDCCNIVRQSICKSQNGLCSYCKRFMCYECKIKYMCRCAWCGDTSCQNQNSTNCPKMLKTVVNTKMYSYLCPTCQ